MQQRLGLYLVHEIKWGGVEEYMRDKDTLLADYYVISLSPV